MKTEKYKDAEKMYVAVDCIIFGFDENVLKLLIFRRKVTPFQGHWSLIGSFVNSNENSEEAARRVLQEITGLKHIFMEELKTYTDVNRDPGGRCISISHYALIRLEESNKTLVESHGAHWHELSQLPELVLDHDQMVLDALQRLRRKASSYPIGFELLPKKFTLPQIQCLYEVIFQKKLDPRNFRKKILSLEILKALPEKDKSTSKKGAFLYEFDTKKYNQLKRKGFKLPLFKKH